MKSMYRIKENYTVSQSSTYVPQYKHWLFPYYKDFASINHLGGLVTETFNTLEDAQKFITEQIAKKTQRTVTVIHEYVIK